MGKKRMSGLDESYREFEQTCYNKLGEDLRSIREQARLPLEDVASILGFQRNALSRIERGQRRIHLIDYLHIIWYFRHLTQDHPAMPLARWFFEKPGRPRLVKG